MNAVMKKTIGLGVILLAMTMSALAVESASPKSVKGRILDNEQLPLYGAVVAIDSNRYATVTDMAGNYTFTDLPDGVHRLTVSYIGFMPVDTLLDIRNDLRTIDDIVMKVSAMQLDEVVVNGVFSGQQRAMGRQKANINITNVVSSDQIGKFPDNNIGDAIKRISGINVQYDQGEARFGQVRGTPAEFSSVTVNGSRIPSAEGDVRNVQLDLIPADMIQAIEVSKTLLPDQDGDAIGGSINLVTKESPKRFTLNAMAGSGYNMVSHKPQLDFGLTVGTRFFKNRLGIMASASYQNAPLGSYNTEFIWEKDDSGTVYLNDYQIRQYYVTRERQSYSLALDYKFNADHRIWVKGMFNNRNDWENRYRVTLKDISPEGKADVRVQTKAGTPDQKNARLERQRTFDLTVGGESRVGIFNIDWKLGYDRASEERPHERYIDFRLKKQNFGFDLSDPNEPWAYPLEGSTMTLNEGFALKELTEQTQSIVEQDYKAALDVESALTNRTKLKFGAKYVAKTKQRERDFYEYTPTDMAGFLQDALTHTVNQSSDEFMPSSKYQAGQFIDKRYVGGLDLNDGALFTKAQVASELAANYEAREDVASVYAMMDSRLGDHLHFMGGLRVEHTALRYTGRIYDDETDEVTPTSPEKSHYTNFLPSLLVKWDPLKDLIVRVGYNQALARPKYSALIPGINISRNDNEIKVGNSNLKPTVSHNIDLNAEYYWKSVGLVSVGIFYKRIEGFIVDEVIFNKDYNGHVWTRFTQPKNAGNADIAGVELSYQRDFGFISPALKCLGFYGTYTYTYSRVTDFNFEGRENETGLHLPGSPTHTANASLFFDKWGLNIRLSYNYASDFIDEMGSNAFYDRYYDAVHYLDLNLGYTFGRKTKFTIYAACNNLLNQPLRYYQGSKAYTMQAEYYGVKFNGGLKINF